MTARSREEIRATIFEVLATVAPEIEPSAIDPDRPLRDQVDLDSFDFLNVIIRLHEVLHVDIPEKDYAELLTLTSAVRYLAARGAQEPPAKA